MRIEVLGVNSDKHTCQCCGKSGLKRVVWLSLDGATPVHYGTTCAARVGGVTGSAARDLDQVVARLKAREVRAAAWHQVNLQARETANRTAVTQFVAEVDGYQAMQVVDAARLAYLRSDCRRFVRVLAAHEV
jgi:hypothetical protein